MSPTVEKLFRAVMALPPAERRALTDALVAIAEHPEMPGQVGEEYLAEIRRRSAQTETEAWVPWSEVRRRVHAQLGITLALWPGLRTRPWDMTEVLLWDAVETFGRGG